MEFRFRPFMPGLFLIALLAWDGPYTASAYPVTFNFTGTFVAADPHSLGGIFPVPILSYPASTITGSFTFNRDTADSNGAGTVGQYNGAIEALTFSVSKPITADAYQFGFNSAGPLQSIAVSAGSPATNQSYVLSASVKNLVPAGPIIDGEDYFAREFHITLLRPSSSVFSTDALPDTPPDRNLFSLYSAGINPNGQFRLVFSSAHGDHALIGNLTSLSGSPVPVPAAFYLFGSGLAGIAAFARRKHTMRYVR